jgi:glycine/D-amino acid oxidase-like deaminating enzyme
MSAERTDVAIIGGGYYGAYVATEIKAQRPDLDVTIIEREAEPFTKASSTNQGQFHMGYMYSADPELAHECVENIDRFSDTFGDAVDHEVTSLYGIHEDSQISADDYAAFCDEVGLPLQVVDSPQKIFGDAVTTAFASAEKTFNSSVIQRIFTEKLALNGVKMATGFNVQRITECASGLQVVSNDRIVEADSVFNVTFADINGLHENSELPKIPVRHDTFLHFVLDLPEEYETTAATVIRGPYASLLPSSFRQGHVLASGQFRRVQSTTIDKPSEEMTDENAYTIYEQAIEEASGYMPVLGLARYRGYTLGTRTAHFDQETGAYTSKALVFEDFGGVPNYHAVLGGKVSCMFDVRDSIRSIVS